MVTLQASRPLGGLDAGSPSPSVFLSTLWPGSWGLENCPSQSHAQMTLSCPHFSSCRTHRFPGPTPAASRLFFPVPPVTLCAQVLIPRECRTCPSRVSRWSSLVASYWSSIFGTSGRMALGVVGHPLPGPLLGPPETPPGGSQPRPLNPQGLLSALSSLSTLPPRALQRHRSSH